MVSGHLAAGHRAAGRSIPVPLPISHPLAIFLEIKQRILDHTVLMLLCLSGLRDPVAFEVDDP